jgi:hypothetical protein
MSVEQAPAAEHVGLGDHHLAVLDPVLQGDRIASAAPQIGFRETERFVALVADEPLPFMAVSALGLGAGLVRVERDRPTRKWTSWLPAFRNW